MQRWTVAADVEALVWDPHSEHRFLVSTEDGLVSAFDARQAGGQAGGAKKGKGKVSGNGGVSKGLFTLSAHEKATCTMSFNPQAPNLLATGSTDRKVKLWDLTGDAPKALVSHSPKAGAVFSVSFCQDVPHILAIGGSKGSVHLWNTLDLKAASPFYHRP